MFLFWDLADKQINPKRNAPLYPSHTNPIHLMPTNSTLPETDNNAVLPSEEESYSSGNGWLAIVVGAIFILALVGYMLMPGEGGRRRIASVMPSVMLGEASVMGARPAKEVAAEPAEPTTEAEAEEAAKALVAAPRPRLRATAETSLDSRQVQAVTSLNQPIAEAAPTVAAPAAPTTFTLTGRILDENGRPLAGATVLLKGSHKGTGTDGSGNYSLEVPAGDNSLVFGYGGYEDQEVHTRGSQPVSVTLLPAEGAKRRRK